METSTSQQHRTELDAVFEAYPGIRLDQVNVPYYAALLERRLVAGHCDECGAWHTPLRSRCPACWSTACAPREVSGRGHVHVLTLLHQGPPGVPYSPPWPLAAVELAEQPGLRIATTLAETPPQQQRVGQPVELTWIERDGAPWPAFRAVAG
ncbi:Zn-ribbon domain-containing OB-fold protein [Nocardia flavorosea]|uniref:Zn-ribbon domain-containing OB-fold protein n=1 Tax=Nocardia flavorosea TaxID=53429 RepID=UPI0007C64F62|nr:OB-fold domain-containing protein [Nocardia flavorosea]